MKKIYKLGLLRSGVVMALLGGFMTVGMINAGAAPTALGDDNQATGDWAAAVGKANNVSGKAAVGMGTSNTVNGEFAVGLGGYNTVVGDRALGLGRSNKVESNFAMATGTGNTVKGQIAMAVGKANTVDGESAMAFGGANDLKGTSSIGIGLVNKIDGEAAVAIGGGNIVKGQQAGGFGQNNKITGTKALGLGQANEVTGDFAVASGSVNKVTATNGVALGLKNYVEVENGVAVGTNALANRAAGTKGYLAGDQDNATWKATQAALSIGREEKFATEETPAVTRQIVGVAAGTNDTDAVNVAQLKKIESTVKGGMTGLDSRITTNTESITVLNGRVDQLDTRVDRIGAGASALAGLHPLDYDPENKWDFAAGYGHYNGANAIAIGAFYRPDENKMISIGGSFGGGENMISAGISVKVGQGTGISTSKAAMANEIRELKARDREREAQMQEIMRQLEILQKQAGK